MSFQGQRQFWVYMNKHNSKSRNTEDTVDILEQTSWPIILSSFCPASGLVRTNFSVVFHIQLITETV